MPATPPAARIAGAEIGAIERQVAEHVATLVPDRATIELGIGLIPEAVTHALRGKHGLGIHSGAIGDGVAELMQAGWSTIATRKSTPASRRR